MALVSFNPARNDEYGNHVVPRHVRLRRHGHVEPGWKGVEGNTERQVQGGDEGQVLLDDGLPSNIHLRPASRFLAGT